MRPILTLVDRYVNKQNYRFCGAENPMIIHEQPTHAHRVTVWRGITNERTIDLFLRIITG